MVFRTHVRAIAIDYSNGNSNWKDSEAMEMKQLAETKHFLIKEKIVRLLLAIRGSNAIWFMT
jgi:hypothetical protein